MCVYIFITWHYLLFVVRINSKKLSFGSILIPSLKDWPQTYRKLTANWPQRLTANTMNNPPSTLSAVGSPGSLNAILSSNRYLISLAAVFVILGSRDLIIEMNSSCKSIFRKSIIKKIVLFSSMFLYARDIRSAAVVSVIMMCLFPSIFFEEDTNFNVSKTQLRCY